MKILLVNTLYYPYKVGGAEISVQSIAEGLHQAGIDVAVVTLGEHEERQVVNNVPVYRLKIQNLFWPFDQMDRSSLKKLHWHTNDSYNTRYNEQFLRIIEEFQPDVIHTNNLTGFSVAIWNLAKAKGIKIVHTLRDYYLQCPKTTKYKNDHSCNKTCIECKVLSHRKKKTSQKVDVVIGLSASILNSHTQLGYFTNATKKVIYNGFDLPALRPDRVRFDNNSQINFGFIGRIHVSKGVEVLCKTLSSYTKHDNWKLYIAGEGAEAYKTYLATLLPEDKVEFLGYVNQADFFKKINVLVVPSKIKESFGRVVIEGLLHSVVVLGTNIGGVRELLDLNKQFIFDPYTNELEKLVRSILNNPAILNAYVFDEQFLQQFAKDKMITDYMQRYQGVIEDDPL